MPPFHGFVKLLGGKVVLEQKCVESAAETDVRSEVYVRGDTERVIAESLEPLWDCLQRVGESVEGNGGLSLFLEELHLKGVCHDPRGYAVLKGVGRGE